MDKYHQENNELFNKFLEDFFYEGYRNRDEGKCIELIFSPKCDLACKYCYVNKYSHKTYPIDIFDADVSVNNAMTILEWMRTNKFVCNFDIFSGELLAQQGGFKLLEEALKFYRNTPIELRPRVITIPTNFTFICSQELTDRVQAIVDGFRELDMTLFLSASFDGKYMEQNRPFAGNLDIITDVVRDDTYYDNVFRFVKKNNFGLHPMIYSKSIEDWPKNFDWFQEMMEKHGIGWGRVFLLQVRNPEWTREQNIKAYEFLMYLWDFLAEKCCGDHYAMAKFIKENGFNILRFPFSVNSRGYTCSIQTDIAIRLADMSVFPCHRLMYEDLKIGQYNSEMEFETQNVELGLGVYGATFRAQPICIRCPLNQICLGGCLGAQYEETGSMFVPIPTVCDNMLYILKGVVDGAVKYGVFDKLLRDNELPAEQRDQLKFVREVNLFGTEGYIDA